MKKIMSAAVGALALATVTMGAAITPAEAHHPAYIWYNGYQYWASNYYQKNWCFYHHGYIYCRHHGGGSSGY